MFSNGLLKSTLAVALLVSTGFAAHAENTDRASAEAACQSGSVLLCENWEDGDWAGWKDYNAGDSLNQDGYRGGPTCSGGDCLLPYPGYKDSRAVALKLPEDAPDAIYPRSAFNETVGVNDTVYARWRVYWSPDFNFNYTNTKHFYLLSNARSSNGGGGTHRVGFFVRPAGGAGSDTTVGVPYFHIYTRDVDVAPGSWQSTKGNDIRYFANQPGSEDFRIEGGKWYEIEIRVSPNPKGQSFGGHLQFWIDGKLMADYSDNVSTRHADDGAGYDGVWLSSYFGGGGQSTHPEQYVVYDDIIASKSRIGVLAPPSSPILRSVR